MQIRCRIVLYWKLFDPQLMVVLESIFEKTLMAIPCRKKRTPIAFNLNRNNRYTYLVYRFIREYFGVLIKIT